MPVKQHDPQALAETERFAWNEKSANYDEYLGSVTQQAVTCLLDAAAVKAGMHVLDVATGPGYAAGGAMERGAKATGVDFAQGMVDEASARFPLGEFCAGDGCALTFDDEFFDAVVCSFGLMLMPDSQQAVAEVFRVLKPSNRYAYSIWDPDAQQAFFGLVCSAINSKGEPHASAETATTVFRFTDRSACCDILSKAGFVDIKVSEIQCLWEPQNADQVLAMIHNSTVRTAALLKQQSSAALEEIHQEILQKAQRYREGDSLRFPWPVIVISGLKPESKPSTPY